MTEYSRPQLFPQFHLDVATIHPVPELFDYYSTNIVPEFQNTIPPPFLNFHLTAGAPAPIKAYRSLQIADTASWLNNLRLAVHPFGYWIPIVAHSLHPHSWTGLRRLRVPKR
jgi:hypothetical protein